MTDADSFANELGDMVASKSPWLGALPADAQEELESVRKRWRMGVLGGKPWMVARLVVELGQKRGWKMPGEHAVVDWLRK